MEKINDMDVVETLDGVVVCVPVEGEKPEGYESSLGEYTPIVSNENEIPFMWGWELVETLGEDQFEALKIKSKLKFIYPGKWYVVGRVLSFSEAMAIYGAVSQVDLGARGGFKSITFGNTITKLKEVWETRPEGFTIHPSKTPITVNKLHEK